MFEAQERGTVKSMFGRVRVAAMAVAGVCLAFSAHPALVHAQTGGDGAASPSGMVAPIKRVRPAVTGGGPGSSGRGARNAGLPQCSAGEVLVRKSRRCERRGAGTTKAKARAKR